MEIYLELKKEIRFDTLMPQLLIEDVSLRNFIVKSGENEALKIKYSDDNCTFETVNESDISFENGFKHTFQIFDNLNDKHVTKNLYETFTKSFHEHKKDEFNKKYLEFREKLLTCSQDENQGNESSQRFRTSSRKNQIMMTSRLIL